MTTSDKFQRHSFKVAFKLTAKPVRSHILTFGIFENRIAGLGSYEDLIIGAGAGAGAAGAGTFFPEPEPEPEPPNSFTRSRSRSRSRNAAPEPEPEPTKNVTAPHPWFWLISGYLWIILTCARDSGHLKIICLWGKRYRTSAGRKYWTARFTNTVELAIDYFGLFLFHLARKANICTNTVAKSACQCPRIGFGPGWGVEK